MSARNRRRRAPIHKYTFEIWPRSDSDRSTPPETDDPNTVSAYGENAEAALKIAAADVPDGWMIYTVGHDRYKCEPAHPGVK